MVYIVHGATGAQGSPVLHALRAAGAQAVAAVRNSEAVAPGITAVSVDLGDAAALTELYRDAEGVFVHLPMGAPEQVAAQAEAIGTAIAQARPVRVVISTSGQIVDQPGSPLQSPEDSPIRSLIRAATASGVSVAVLAPRLYLENLLLPVVIGHAQETGALRYPLPAEFPVSWSSHLDVADAVVRLLTDTSVTGTVAVGALPGITGPGLADAFAQRFGSAVHYEALTPQQFGELITPMFGPAAAPVVGLYEALGAQSENVIAEANSAQELLGLQPRTVADWLRELGV